MSTRAGRGRRTNANLRLREGFLPQAAAELKELAHLLADEPEAQDSVAFELRRLADTAGALQLEAVARAATDAAEELETGEAEGPAVLRRTANAIRHSQGRQKFGPLVVVVGEPTASQLTEDARLCVEPVQIYADLPSFAEGLHTEQPTAVVLPAQATDAVAQLTSREDFPVLVYGPPSAWSERAAAIEAGAHGFLVEPFTLYEVARMARWRTRTIEEAFQVLLVADASDARDRFVAALEDAGVATIPTANPTELSVALDAGTPHAVVLGAKVGKVGAWTMARLVRSHPRCNHVPILVTGRPEDPAGLRALGVDDIMRADAAPAQATQRVKDRVTRMAALQWERDPVSGLLNRPGVLRALDGELAKASRTGQVLSVALVGLDGLDEAVDTFGAPALREARLRLVELFQDNLRRTDLFGEVGLGEILLALPGCGQTVTERRLERLGEAFQQTCRRDARLRAIQWTVGVADTESGLSGVAIRADKALRGMS